MNFVPCLAWVAKSIAKPLPHKLQLSAEELKRLVDETKKRIEVDGASDEELEDEEVTPGADKSLGEINAGKRNVEEELSAKYDLDNYDDDDEKPFMNINDVAVHVDNQDDEYITDITAVEDDEKDDDEDYVIKSTDNLLVVGHMEDSSSILEIHVYNKDEGSFYVHHDIVLDSFPLALEWLDYNPADENPGNYIAVGDMSPVIKIFDLDVVDVLEPDYTLGKEIKKKKKIKLEYHSDPVISLSWNKSVRNILASGSADNSIILWDLHEGTVMKKLEFHTGKVQALSWHPFESSFLLSGCTEGLVVVYDCRSDADEFKSWRVEGEVERVCWNLFDSSKFFCSTDAGCVHSINMKETTVEGSENAHAESVTALDMSSERPDILLTASMDKYMKLWNIEDGFKLVDSCKLKVGSIHVAKLVPDSGMIAAVGGNNDCNNLKIVDLAEKLNGEITA